MIGEIERRLVARLVPLSLVIDDESSQHIGHVGAQGGGHYRVRIVAARFAGLPRVARHRLVYDAVSDLMQSAVHALAIEALTPDEARDEGSPPSPAVAA